MKWLERFSLAFTTTTLKGFRANVVRKHDMLKDRSEAGFFDYSIWEDAKLHGDSSVKRLVDSALTGTSVTCVLIGSETWKRRWVRYEILKSYEKGNKLLGVHINSVKGRDQKTLPLGNDPFDYVGFTISDSGKTRTYHEHDGRAWRVYSDLPRLGGLSYARKYWGTGHKLSNWVPVYDWVADDGYNNFADWVEDL